jgi:thioredoxin-related protein
MEDNVFLRPAVAGILKEHFVEARLHCDLQKHLTAEQFARNRELQKQYASSKAMPIFVVVDPKTGRELGETPVVGLSPAAQTENFAAFLQQMVAARGK